MDWVESVSKIPVDGSGEEPDICIIEVRVGLNGPALVASQLTPSRVPCRAAPRPLSARRHCRRH